MTADSEARRTAEEIRQKIIKTSGDEVWIAPGYAAGDILVEMIESALLAEREKAIRECADLMKENGLFFGSDAILSLLGEKK